MEQSKNQRKRLGHTHLWQQVLISVISNLVNKFSKIPRRIASSKITPIYNEDFEPFLRIFRCPLQVLNNLLKWGKKL